MRLNLQIRNIQRLNILGRVVELVKAKNLQKTTLSARNKQKFLPQLKNELGGVHQWQ